MTGLMSRRVVVGDLKYHPVTSHDIHLILAGEIIDCVVPTSSTDRTRYMICFVKSDSL